MPLDDLALGLQRVLDRLVRRLRLGAAPAPGRRRLLIVQIDGLSRAVLEESIVLAWVLVKASLASVIELSRAALRIVADPLSVSTDGWKWLAIKIGISVWLRELFTLAVAHDLYGGVPTIYVNYLDYDVVAHAWGPRHRRAFRALRRVDAPIPRLGRVFPPGPGDPSDLSLRSAHG